MQSASFKTLMTICRKTLGWDKEIDKISLSQIEELTGLPRKTVIRTIKDLEHRNLIIVDRTKKINSYQLNLSSDTMSPIQNKVVTSCHQTSDKSTPDASDMRSPTKEKKETITKENNNESKNDSLYTQIVDLIYQEYYKLYKIKLIITGQEGKLFKKIIEKAKLTNKENPLQAVKDKIEIIKNMKKDNNFWKLTPAIICSKWNEIVDKESKIDAYTVK